MDKKSRFALVALFHNSQQSGQAEGITSLRGRLGVAASVEFSERSSESEALSEALHLQSEFQLYSHAI